MVKILEITVIVIQERESILFSKKLTGTNWGLSSTPFSSVGTVKHILSKESVVGSAFIFDNISTEGFDQNSPGVFNLWQVSNLTSAHS